MLNSTLEVCVIFPYLFATIVFYCLPFWQFIKWHGSHKKEELIGINYIPSLINLRRPCDINGETSLFDEDGGSSANVLLNNK